MDWFKHDSNANLDDKLQLVLMDYGLEGYGLYWYCLELIVGRVSADNITFELKHDARVIAKNTCSTVQKVEEMMTRFVELGLFESTNGTITCFKVAKRLMSSATSNATMRQLISNINQNNNLQKPSCLRHDAVMKEEKRRDENRTDKKKHIVGRAAPDDLFQTFWKLYPKKVGKDAALRSWIKLGITASTFAEIEAALKWQIASDQWRKNSGQFIPNPATYLNQGRWQDEQPKYVGEFDNVDYGQGGYL